MEEAEPERWGVAAGLGLCLGVTVVLGVVYGALQHWLETNAMTALLLLLAAGGMTLGYSLSAEFARLPRDTAHSVPAGLVLGLVFTYVQWVLYAVLDGAGAGSLDPRELWAFIEAEAVDPTYPDWRTRSSEGPGSVSPTMRGVMWALEALLFTVYPMMQLPFSAASGDMFENVPEIEPP